MSTPVELLLIKLSEAARAALRFVAMTGSCSLNHRTRDQVPVPRLSNGSQRLDLGNFIQSSRTSMSKRRGRRAGW
ncbi:hypothetical protein LshimejAT787_0401210 [Lyophyllum shimeji]|uniref:Uncharacterized protein n=1 Tax=Lyophyllum shimeji TaxID=47721 RepID=A0A9P3PJH5_LYOSH|nr:hypothetical protein LshimejAT787_0401210 [Lyophyllum shimeji]